MDKTLKLYTYVDGINDIPFPSIKDQIEILQFAYDVKTMGGTPSISASIMYKDCLDNVWSGKQYAVYNGEKYYIKQIASSSYSNTDARYKHDIELVSDRFMLESTYFYDAVVENEDVDKYVSNSTKVSFFGDINELVHRLNKSMKRSGLPYSIVIDSDVTSEAFLVSFDNEYISNALQSIFEIYGLSYYYAGYVIHVCKDFKEIPYVFKYGIENSLLKIEKTNANYKVIRRCSATGSSDNIPYYYPNDTPKGNVLFSPEKSNTNLLENNIHVLDGDKLSANFNFGDRLQYIILHNLSAATEIVSYLGFNGKELLYTSPSYTIAGFTASSGYECPFSTIYKMKVLMDGEYSITFKRVVENISPDFGTYDRIPWNEEGVCRLSLGNSDPKPISYTVEGSDVIKLDLGFLKKGSYKIEIIEKLVGKYLRFSITQFIVVESTFKKWRKTGGDKYYDLEKCGIKVDWIPKELEAFTILDNGKIPYSTNLLPYKYRETEGAERFYNALNDTYINPDTGEYYQFENQYTSNNPSEYVVELDDIKPTIKGSINKANQRIDMFSEFAYDTNDNDELTADGEYVHPYFFGKLRKFDGDNSFNLFEHAIESGEMTISMTSGNCGACNFVIGVDKDSQKNLVQVDSNGQLLRDKDGDVRCGRKKSLDDSPIDAQNDTSKNEVWIALRKDKDTFNVLMPNSLNNYKPTANSDTFVILNISLPKSYIIAAEKKIERELIKYMSQNNSEKFNFSIDLSRIFLAQNPNIYSQLNENSKLKIEYNSSIYSLYVSSYTYTVTDTEVLPQIKVDLQETLTINKGVIQNAVDGVKRDITNVIASIDPFSEGNKYYLKKNVPDTAEKKITFKEGFDVGDYEKFISGASLFIDSDGKTNLDIDKLHVRLKAYFETLEIKKAVHTGGINISSAASLICSKVVDRNEIINPETGEIIDTIIWDYYRCYFVNNKEGVTIYNEFRDGDQAYSKNTNIEDGFTNRFYWRLVVGTGTNYIDLSKTDCILDSSEPQVGDSIIQYGNRYDTLRQNIIVQSTVSDDSPSLKFYQGVNSYDLYGKEVMSFYYDRVTRKSQMKVYGDAFIGKADNSSYMKYTTENGLEIKGKLSVGTTMGDGSTLEDALEKYKNDAINVSNKNLADYASQVTTDIDDLQNQIDGAVESYFKEYDPTLNNEPANAWLTDPEKERHGNDTFTNSITGKSWRWAKLNGQWQWVVITDTATEKALAAAAKAQDTADGKRKVFVRQPLNTEDYAIGDLWVNATYGTTYLNDLLRAKTAKKPNIAFDIAHWELASKYTDDKKALEALKAAADAAADAAAAQKSADAAKGSVSDLNDYVDNAFKDGIISNSEAISISNYINEVNNNKLSLDNQFTKLYSNIYLEGDSKTNLQSAKSALDAATSALILAINNAIADSATTKEEKAEVDAKYGLYNQANATFITRIEEANKAIQDKLKSYSDAASLAAASAATAAANAQASANEAKASVSTLNEYVDNAFKDGIISSSEALAIQTYINSVNNTKESVKATYEKLYNNAFLKGAAKTDLNAKYTALNTAIANLILSINTAIADKATTPEEKADVDAKYALFNTATANFNTSIEVANKAIQDELKTYSDAALLAAQTSQADATKALADAAAVNKKVSDLNFYIDNAFKDGIIDLSEATAIEKYINAINESKKVNDAIYIKLYSNPYLEGDSKTNLKTQKEALDIAITNLLTAINDAISDGLTTKEEKDIVDAKYNLYSVAIASFSTAIEAANNAIQDKLKNYSEAAKEAADAAQLAANNAQSSANDAIYKLTDIANDNKLTPEEKQSTKKEWDIIASEKPKNDAIADIFEVSRSAYDSAYEALSIYITPLLESLSVTSNIIGTDFRLKFKLYYDARTSLLNSIAEKAKSLADAAASSAYQALLKAADAQEAAEAARGVADAAKLRLDNWAADSVISPTEKQSIKDEKARIEADQRDIYNGYTKYGLGIPTAYDAAYTKYRTQLVALSALSPENIPIPSDFTTNQTNYYTQRTLALDAISTAAKKIATDALNNANSALGQIGDFKPVKDALLQETNIEGGLILSSLMALGYKENTVFKTMSGVSGLYNPNKIGGGIAFWSGGAMKDLADYEGEASIPSDVAAGVDRHDGSGYRAFGNMSWNRKGELTVATQYLKIISSTGISKLEYSSTSDQLIFNGNTLFKGVNTFKFEDTAHLTIGSDAFDYLSFLKWLRLTIEEDSVNNAIKFNKTLYSTGGISAKGFTESGGGGGGGGLIETVYGYNDLGKTFSDSVLTNTFNAYTINKLADRIKVVEGSTISEVKWSIITGKPTTIAGYGITDAVLSTDARLTDARNAKDVYAWAKTATKPTYTYSEVGAEAAFTKNTAFNKNFGTAAGTVAQGNDSRITNGQTAFGWGNHASAGYVSSVLIGAANGIAPLDANKLIPSSYLPSYVDDVLEYANKAGFPASGESGKIYVAIDSNLTYRWSGSAYVEISPSLALGETSATAYAGDKGKAAADAITALKAISISAGVGLTGGGNLTANRVLALAASGVSAGTYTKVTVDAYGRVTVGSSMIESDIPTLSISKVSGLQSALDSKATSSVSIIAGLGLIGGGTLSSNITLNIGSATDGITINADNIQLNVINALNSTSTTKPLSAAQGKLIWDSFYDMFEKVNVGTSAAPIWAIRAKYGFYSDSFISAKGASSSGGSGGGIVENVYAYSDITKAFSDSTLTDTFNAYTISKLASRITSLEKGSITSVDWSIIVNKPSWIGSSKPTYAFSEIGSKPTTLSGYGITDGITASTANNSFLSKGGDTVNGYLTFPLGRSIRIIPAGSGGNASGLYHYAQDNTTIISGIGTYTSEGNFGYSYLGWGTSPWVDNYNLSVGNDRLTYKGNNIYHAGNFNPANYLLLAGGTMTGVLMIQDGKGTANGIQTTAGYGLLMYNGDSEVFISQQIGTTYIRSGATDLKHRYDGTDYNILDARNYSSYALPLTGGTVSGNVTISGFLTGVDTNFRSMNLPYIAGSWIQMATSNYQLKPLVTQSATSAHSLYKVTANNGSVLAFGGLGNQIGFYMFSKTNIDNNTNSSVGEYKFDLGNYLMYHGPYNMLDSGNYGNWIPSKTGTGASGTWGINISGTAAKATLADDAYNIAVGGSQTSGTATGWFRIANCNPDSSGTNIILQLNRHFAYANNEAYTFSISITYSGNISITQLSGTANDRLISKIRVTGTATKTFYIDLYIATSTTDNRYMWRVIGDGNGYSNWVANPAVEPINVEFTTVNGFKSSKGIVGDIIGNADSATKLETTRTIWGQPFDGTANVSGDLGGCTRIYNKSSGILYLGNFDNTGWVQAQDICSDGGAANWSLRREGVGHMRRLNLGATESDNVNYRLIVSGDSRHMGMALMNATDTSGNYSTRAIQLREVNTVGNTQTSDAYAPAIGFHWMNVTAAILSLHSDGNFHFTGETSQSSAYRYLHANGFKKAGSDGNYALTGDGGHLKINANSAEVNTLVQRTSDGYIYGNYFRTYISQQDSSVTSVYYETNNDNFIRKKSLANFVSDIEITGTYIYTTRDSAQRIASSYPLQSELISNNGSGSHMIGIPLATPNTSSGHLMFFDCGGGSTRYTQIYSRYDGSLTWRNSTNSDLSNKPWRTILDSSNYNSYSPTLTGTGASGNWNITSSKTNLLNVIDTRASNPTPDQIQSNAVTAWFSNSGTPTSEWWSGFSVGGWTTSYERWQIASRSANTTGGSTNSLYFRSGLSATWNDWKVLLDSSNYNAYAPTLTGKGASGAWGISITGNSAATYKIWNDAASMTFHWSGQGGQPTWLWGGNSSGDMYVYNPSNFSVSYASSAGSAPASDVYAWAKASSKPSYSKSEVGLGSVDNTADSVKNVLSATKLTTARTLWGRSFDGTGNITGGLDSVTYISASGNISANYVNGNALGVTQSSGSGIGLSLYNGATSGFPTYGIAFATTQNGGSHGDISGDWATYFTMSNTDDRGWIFKRVGGGNVASISAAGHACFNGYLQTMHSLYITGNAYINYDATAKGLHTNVGFYSDSYISAKGVSNTTSSDKRLKCDFQYLNYDEILLAMGKVVSYKYNKRGQELGNDDERHIGSIYQKVEEFMPTIVGVDRNGYGYINYISPDYISLIAGACQLNTLGLYDVMDSVESLEDRVERLEQENVKLKQEVQQLRTLTK